MHNEDEFELEKDQEEAVVEWITPNPTPQEWVPEATLTTAELVAIYQLLKAGFTAEDFN